VRVAKQPQSIGDFADRRIPRDRLKRAVRATTKGLRQPLRRGLVMIQPQRLLTGIPLRHRVRLIAANLGQVAVFHARFDTAVKAAQDACGRLPGFIRGGAHDDFSAEPTGEGHVTGFDARSGVD
jgi:hypothetical protein